MFGEKAKFDKLNKYSTNVHQIKSKIRDTIKKLIFCKNGKRIEDWNSRLRTKQAQKRIKE